MCGLGNETYPKFLPPALNFLLQILKLEKGSKTKKKCSAVLFQLQNLKIKDISYDHLRQKSKFLCMQSSILEVKGLKQS